MKKFYNNLLPANGNIIAETACNHEGDILKIYKIIDCVSKSQTNLIKFQVFLPEERVTEDHKEFNLFKKFSFTKSEWIKISKYASTRGLYIFTDIFGVKSFEITKLMNVIGYKIHSGDLLNTEIIKKVAKTKKILLLGIGGSHRKEVFETIKYLYNNKLSDFIVVMPGIQNFPTSIKNHSLDVIRELKLKYSKYGVKIGFADHLSGNLPESINLPLMAFASGACIVEKHITYKRSDKWEDYESALNSKDFSFLTKQAKKLCKLLINKDNYTKQDYSYRQKFKKAAFLKKDFPKNHILSFQDIEYKKGNNKNNSLLGLSLIGKKLKYDLKKNKRITNADLVSNVGAIIIARCSSSRLPNKAILKIENKESISLLINRIKTCKELSTIVLATTNLKSDDVLVKIAKREKISFYRGSLNNVALRVFNAAKKNKIDHIVRITADDILRDEKMIDKAIIDHLKSCCDVTITENMPYGTSTEILTIETLEKVVKQKTLPDNTEYLEHILDNSFYFSVNKVKSSYNFDKRIRLTLDYKEDLVLFKKIFKLFYKQNHIFPLTAVINYLNKNKKLIKINSDQKIKLTKNQINKKLYF